MNQYLRYIQKGLHFHSANITHRSNMSECIIVNKLLTDEPFLSPSIFFTGDLKHSVPIEGNALDKISAKSVEESNPAADSRAIIISSKQQSIISINK